MAAVTAVLSLDEGKEFEAILQETRLAKTTVWSVLGELKAQGIVIIVGHRKTESVGGHGKRALYALATDPKPPVDDGAMKHMIARIKGALARDGGHFAGLIAQVTAD